MDETLDNQKTIDDDDFSPMTPENLAPGMLLGENRNYRLEKLLGSGTYGQAWLATEFEGGNELRKVVCKVLPALIQKEKDEMEKVIRTFQLVQPLTHQYICPIYALKSDPACGYFFVLAYADGGTLWDWFVRQPSHANGLPVSRVVDALRPVAMALDHAHANGVVHRDVKPQNILLALRGGRKIPWLSDFGVSAQIHRTVTQTAGARGRSGTPSYMAPEQCLPNQEQDGRTDQYALGVLAYLFLSGRLPFDADDPVALWGQIVYSPVPPLANVPESVNAAVLRALAKKPEERFNSCVEFINALKEPGVSKRIVPPPLKEPVVSKRIVPPPPKAPIVSKNIVVPGTFETLEEAYEKAPDGAIITIKPGKYELSKTLVINRKVTFRGETGDPESVVIDCPDFDAFKITGGSPSFQNLTAISGGDEGNAFCVTGGTPQFFRCIITSRKTSGMVIKGKETSPVVEQCLIKDCGGSGVYIGEEARGEFRGCDIYGNDAAGIGVTESANPTVIKCKIHDGGSNGVAVSGGFGLFRGCDIYANSQVGIGIVEGGNPTIIGCRIHDGKSIGVASKGGLGEIQDCEIYANTDVGVAVMALGNPTVTGCRILDGKSSGVFVSQEGRGVFQDCDIYGNVNSGIQVKSFGNPTVTGCKIHDGNDVGVYIIEKGMGTFNNNTLFRNYWEGMLHDWLISESAGVVKGSGNNPEIPKKTQSFWKSLFG